MNEKIQKGIILRLYPSNEQKIAIHKSVGVTRFLYNHFLNIQKERHIANEKLLSYGQMDKMLPVLKQKFKWLREIDSTSQQRAVRRLSEALKLHKSNPNHFGFPQFKAKKISKLSYTTVNNNESIRIKGRKVKLPKLGFVNFRQSKHFKFVGKILSSVVWISKSGKYFCFIAYEVEKPIHIPKAQHDAVGLDMGIKHLIITSDGVKFENYKYYSKYEKQLIKWQRIFSKRIKGFNNREKARMKIARIHEKIANCRKDIIHKITTKLVNENQVICLEDLAVSNLLSNHKLAKSISDASWNMIRNFITYKSNWKDRIVQFVSRAFPSSQLCSTCNTKNKDVKNLNLREWTCPNCSTSHDRDVNAAINIRNEGLRLLLSQ